MNKSKIDGIILKHADGDAEIYKPTLSETDQNKIYKILEKYGDNNESMRGDLAIYNAEKVKEAARRLYEFLPPWERLDTSEEETAEEIRKNPIDAILFLLDTI